MRAVTKIRILGIMMILGVVATFSYYGYTITQLSLIDKEIIGFYVACSIPPLGGLAGGIACLLHKDEEAKEE